MTHRRLFIKTNLTWYIVMTDYKNKIKALAERNRLATTDEERAAVVAEMNALRREDEQAFAEALEGLIKMTAEDVQEMRMANRLGDIADVEKITDMKKQARRLQRHLLRTSQGCACGYCKPSENDGRQVVIFAV